MIKVRNGRKSEAGEKCKLWDVIKKNETLVFWDKWGATDEPTTTPLKINIKRLKWEENFENERSNSQS